MGRSASASASLPSDSGPESTRFLDNRPPLSPELPVPELGRGPPLDPEEHESVRGRSPELLSEAWL